MNICLNCGHPEDQHETVEYREGKPRRCVRHLLAEVDRCPCSGFRSVPTAAERLMAEVKELKAILCCTLNCDSPSYPPTLEEYRQCGCANCRRYVAEHERKQALARVEILEAVLLETQGEVVRMRELHRLISGHEYIADLETTLNELAAAVGTTGEGPHVLVNKVRELVAEVEAAWAAVPVAGCIRGMVPLAEVIQSKYEDAHEHSGIIAAVQAWLKADAALAEFTSFVSPVAGEPYRRWMGEKVAHIRRVEETLQTVRELVRRYESGE